MGGKIKTVLNENTYIVNGVDSLKNSCACEIIPDRIEAGTYMIAAALIERLENKNWVKENFIFQMSR